MIPIMPSIRLLTYHEHAEIRLQALVLEYQNYCYHLQGQTGDNIQVFRHGICIYVLTNSTPWERISLYAYMTPEADPINSIHLISEKEIREVLGKSWNRLSAKLIVERLLDCM